jgi:hypothetical protein
VPLVRDRRLIADDAAALYAMWKDGRLGGEVMPEDAHPDLPTSSNELAAYFTLGMCLNYQRNSYALWRACTATFNDSQRGWVFDANAVMERPADALAEALLHQGVALQPNRHPGIWRRVALGLVRHAGGNVRSLFEAEQFDLALVRDFIRSRREDFPYLCGPKIANYWLYVMSSYMTWPFINRSSLSVAPDRHVVAASIRLGLLEPVEAAKASAPLLAAERWSDLLAHSPLPPIDVHTPLWLWSRLGFPDIATRQQRGEPEACALGRDR